MVAISRPRGLADLSWLMTAATSGLPVLFPLLPLEPNLSDNEVKPNMKFTDQCKRDGTEPAACVTQASASVVLLQCWSVKLSSCPPRMSGTNTRGRRGSLRRSHARDELQGHTAGL